MSKKAKKVKKDNGIKLENIEINPETIKDLNTVNDSIITLNKKFEETIQEIMSLAVEKLLKQLPYSDKVIEDKLKTGQISIGQVDNLFIRYDEPMLFAQMFTIREGSKVKNYIVKIPMRSKHKDIMDAVTPKNEKEAKK